MVDWQLIQVKLEKMFDNWKYPTLHLYPIQFWSIALVCCWKTLKIIIWIACSSMSIVVNTFSWETGCFGDDSLNPGIALVVSVSCVAIYEAGVKWSPSRQCRHMLSIASAHSSTTEHKRILHQKAHQRDCDIMWYYNIYALYITEKCVSRWQFFFVVCCCSYFDVKGPCIVKDF